MRGILPFLFSGFCSCRITPACAGNTSVGWEHLPVHQDHPRLCGEYDHQERDIRGYVGSPPPVRGILLLHLQTVKGIRITPACAGNTNLGCLCVVVIQDHPRLCGEYQLVDLQRYNRKGSPPPVRGILSDNNSFKVRLRITPACAGNTAYFNLIFPTT